MSELKITRVYDLLLRGTPAYAVCLYHINLATAEQLCRLHYSPGSIKSVKARLKDLTDSGYIQHDTIPTKEMNAPYYYTLTRKGQEYLAEQRLEANDALRDSKEVDKGAWPEFLFSLSELAT